MYGHQAGPMDGSTAQGRNTNAIMANWVDRGPWLYYDTVVGTAGTPLSTSYSMFSIPIGAQNPQTSAANTKLTTNLTRPNQFPPPRCLLLNALCFYFSSTMLKIDVDAILDGSYAEFKIDDKIFHEGPLYFFPSGMGLMGLSTQNGESAYTNGLPAPQGARRMGTWSKYIAPQQQFSLLITFNTAYTPVGAVRFQAILDGLTDRSVQ